MNMKAIPHDFACDSRVVRDTSQIPAATFPQIVAIPNASVDDTNHIDPTLGNAPVSSSHLIEARISTATNRLPRLVPQPRFLKITTPDGADFSPPTGASHSLRAGGRTG